MTPTLQPSVRPEPAIRARSDSPTPFSPVPCTQCGSYRTTRTHRRTFFQREILFRLGYFPWKCIDCAHRFVARDRGHY